MRIASTLIAALIVVAVLFCVSSVQAGCPCQGGTNCIWPFPPKPAPAPVVTPCGPAVTPIAIPTPPPAACAAVAGEATVRSHTPLRTILKAPLKLLKGLVATGRELSSASVAGNSRVAPSRRLAYLGRREGMGKTK